MRYQGSSILENHEKLKQRFIPQNFKNFKNFLILMIIIIVIISWYFIDTCVSSAVLIFLLNTIGKQRSLNATPLLSNICSHSRWIYLGLCCFCLLYRFISINAKRVAFEDQLKVYQFPRQWLKSSKMSNKSQVYFTKGR